MNLQNDRLLTPVETAELLGLKPSTLAVWRCNKSENLLYIKIGNAVRYKRSDVEKFIEEKTISNAS